MEGWLKKQRELLEIESQSEASQLLEKIRFLPSKLCEQEGLSICNLEVLSTKTELFGRCCVEFQKIGKLSIPSGFKVGDEVTITSSEQSLDSEEEGDDPRELYGLVKKCNNFSIEIVFDEYERSLAYPPLRLNLRPSLTTHHRMMDVLEKLQSTPHPLFNLVHSPDDFPIYSSFLYSENERVSKWYNGLLNESQKEAIECCLNSSLVSIIHGPPGTGKTATLAELILQHLERNRKLLVCAPSNIAVDTILNRVIQLLGTIEVGRSTGLAKYRDRIVRIGHPARIAATILQYTLDYHIENDDGTQIVRDIHEEIQNLRSQLQRRFSKKSKSSVSKTSKEMRSELKQIRKEANEREKAVVQQILSNAQIIFSTCVGAASSLIRDLEFDVTVIDEAAQGIEASCWIPIMKSRKIVLAGDHCQLPPTIKSTVAAQGGLQVTLFERIIKDTHFQNFCKLLRVQYRMNDVINQWASNQMYGGQVISDNSVANHTIDDIISADPNTTTLPPVALMIDTSGEYMYEEELSSENGKSSFASHRNIHEAYLTLQHCLYLMSLGVSSDSIGIITPYNGQLEILRQLFESYSRIHNVNNLSQVELKTIDGFQGGEKECILISFVRSNVQRNIGFLSERRRMNVAVTRAKRHLAIIGDSSTCGSDEFINSLINHIEQSGEIISPSAYNEYYFPPIVENLINIPRSINTQSVMNNHKSSLSKNENSKKSNKEKSAPKKDVLKPPTFSNPQPNQTPLPKPLKEDNDDRREQIKAVLQLYKEKKLVGGSVKVKDNSGKMQFEYDYLLLHERNSSASTLPLQFPAELNSFERMLVHELAGIIGLQHESKDLDLNRRVIEVSHPVALIENDLSQTHSDEIPQFESEEVTPINTQESCSSATVLPPERQKSKHSKQKKISRPPQPTLINSLDEDALLELAIRQNQELASLHKYRVGSSPLLNPEKEASKSKLKSKLQEAQEARRATVPTPNQESNNRKKIVKKPVPNFGGGKVGSKE